MKRKGKKLAVAKRSFSIEFARYLGTVVFIFIIIVFSWMKLPHEKSIFDVMYDLFAILVSSFAIYILLFNYDAVYENGLKYYLSFWWFDRIRCIEVGEMVDEKNSKYRILVIHSDDKPPLVFTELHYGNKEYYRNKDFFYKVIEECQKRCTRAVWIPMSPERKREIIVAQKKLGVHVPVIVRNFVSKKIGSPHILVDQKQT